MLSRVKYFLRQSEPSAIVLMYHRVFNVKTDPWQLSVSPHNFETQIKTITKNFKVLPLTELARHLSIGKITPNSVYITFDDAYNDNYLYARPVLEKYDCPATFFVPTHFIGKQQWFWWDELEAIILHSKTLPSKLTLQIDEKIHYFQFKIEKLTDEIQQKHQTWNWPEHPPTNRCKLYLNIWELLKPLPFDMIDKTINYIKNWADFTPSKMPENFPMSSEQLKGLANNKLFTLGVHTETHPALASHSAQIQIKEIAGSKNYLESNNYSIVNAIAYPYGDYNDETLSAVKQNEIALGFTTVGEAISRNSSPLRLGRLQVANYNGALLNEKLFRIKYNKQY